MPITCIAGDLHFPWASKPGVRAFLARVRYVKPAIIVQNGDLFDCFSWGRFPRTTCLMTPAQEIKAARKQAEEFWAACRSAAGKKAEFFQVIGNHDERPIKQLMANLPDFQPFADTLASWWKFDGVETQSSQRNELIIDRVCYMHGFRKHGDHVKHNLMSTVVGHTHLGGTVYYRHGNRTLFELNAGYLGDPHATALSYTSQRRILNWTRGMGEVEDGEQARFISL